MDVFYIELGAVCNELAARGLARAKKTIRERHTRGDEARAVGAGLGGEALAQGELALRFVLGLDAVDDGRGGGRTLQA